MSDENPKLEPDLLTAAHGYAFTLVPNEVGGYDVDVPAFGERILTGGDTPEEAARNAVEAIALALEWHVRTNTPFPEGEVAAGATR